MANAQLTTYLNDHLAGSLSAVELLDHLESVHTDTPLARFFAELRDDVTADRQELKALMEYLQIAPSRPRQMMAWITEKIATLKLRMEDPDGASLQLLESLEVLSLGIEGKQNLWHALKAAAEDSPGLRRVNYERLAQRAEEQRRRVEVVRLNVARTVLLLDG